ncbi:class I SAM-dependent methyltransferase [Noviherbaspirillum sedimenti]|uniref:Class I SAM-dependent methyltransferase n=1 Tax=Noviherbaspirillum sedimenti TaxID=2320865 RepID=A0A3A3G3Z3_9BURK|nr:class I SAM-dependent methyltransferase [Noviherbaspirillum sedimenti]RJG01212.1 class I SAM-dependent methyltransferase [Noviherbaspirillum sedimenti]
MSAASARVRQFWRAPALHALLHQCVAFFAAIAILAALELRGIAPPHLLGAALIQGALAAMLSAWRRLAPWWLPIQLLFAPALVAMHGLQLPPLLFLGLFILLLLLYWSSFRTQVPYYPSTKAVWQAVAGLLPPHRPLRCIDIGSGFGGLVLHLAAMRPDSLIAGIELAPLPWLVSRLRARLQHSRARFMRGDYLDLDFADYDVVFAYLSPAAMPALWEKAHSEMRPGTLLLSHEFAIPGRAADLVVAPRRNAPVLYGWRMQAQAVPFSLCGNDAGP